MTGSFIIADSVKSPSAALRESGKNSTYKKYAFALSPLARLAYGAFYEAAGRTFMWAVSCSSLQNFDPNDPFLLPLRAGVKEKPNDRSFFP